MIQRTILCLIFLLLYVGLAYTQNIDNTGKYDIIYFKNGKTVEGIIVKQELGTVSIKVVDNITQQEKVRIYQQDEIKKIQKRPALANKSDSIPSLREGKADRGRNPQQMDAMNNPSSDAQNLLIPDQPQKNIIVNQVVQAETTIQIPTMSDGPVMIDGNRTANPDDYFDPFSVPRPRRKENIWNREIRGFRAFLDYAYIQGFGDKKNNRLEYMTSVGFQFNPIFYTGLGAGYDLTINKKESFLPFFINQRINFIDEYTTPFWDLKAGYSVGEGKGLYLSTSFGVSFTKKGNSAFNVGLVYSLQKSKYYDWKDESKTKRIAIKPTYHGLSLKITYEFGIGR